MIALKASYEVRKMMRSLVDVDCRIYGLLVKSTHHRLREVASITRVVRNMDLKLSKDLGVN